MCSTVSVTTFSPYDFPGQDTQTLQMHEQERTEQPILGYLHNYQQTFPLPLIYTKKSILNLLSFVFVIEYPSKQNSYDLSKIYKIFQCAPTFHIQNSIVHGWD